MKKLTLIFSMMIALIGFNANAAMYIVGNSIFGDNDGNWDPNGGIEMTQNGDTYSAVVEITGTVYFVFADGRSSDWTTFNRDYRYGPTQSNEQVTAGVWKNTQKAGDHGAYFFEGTGGKYEITFDDTNKKFMIDGYVAPIEITVYTVTGPSSVFGSNWNETDASNDMELIDGVYTWSKNNVELNEGTLEYKVVGNHSWGHEWPVGMNNNFTKPVSTHGYYNITITFDPETGMADCTLVLVQEIVDPIEETSYTVAGTENLFGSDWNPADTTNDMVLVDGLYTWTKENVVFEAVDTIEFKVVKNHSWDVASYPENNWWYEVAEAGTYNFVITFDAATQNITFTATKQGGEEPPVGEDTYTVAGTENLFGSFWNPADTTNDMALNAETGLYTWTKSNVVFEDVDTIEFKVVKNHSWDVAAYPENNWWYRVAEAGTYDFVITFNAETQEVGFTATKQGEEPPVVEDTYTVAGTPNLFGSFWEPADTTNDMVLNAETGLYTWTKNDVVFEDVDTIEFKVVKNHSWDVASYPENNWWYRVASEGTYDFVITFNPETQEVGFTATKQGGEEPPVEMVYTVVGPAAIFGNDWAPADTTNDMILNAETGLYTWTKSDVTLYGNFEFKVVGNHDYAIYEWPIGMNNWVANVPEEGIYTIEITFDPEAADSVRIACTLTKTGDIGPVEHTYTVAGTPNLFTSFWDETDVNNDMVKGEDGIYTWTKSNVVFEAVDTIQFKVVQDHAWTYAWPSSNWWYEVTEPGTYDFVITFNPEADDMNKITFTATKQSDVLIGDVNEDGEIDITDVTLLISAVLTGDLSAINTANADCDGSTIIDITDVTMLIARVLTGAW